MTHREIFSNLLAGAQPDPVPQWIMSIGGDLARDLMPAKLLYDGYDEYPRDGAYPFTPMGPERLEAEQRFNRHIDRCAFPVGWGANAAFGHCGPGEFNTRVVEREENRFVVAYETGARREVRRRPHFVHTSHLPVESAGDLDRLSLPDPDDPARYAGLTEDVAWAKARGEWTVAWLNGFFSGVHYFLRDYAAFLLDLAAEPDFARATIAVLGEWNLAAARRLCETGVDCIGLCDDLGSEKAMLISPAMYESFIFPWHKRLCDLAHERGVVVHLHSHGAILPIAPRLAEAGFDLLNPLDPDDGMPLTETRKVVGERIVLCGGMDKHFWDWPADEQRTFLETLIATARENAPFILMDSGGVPDSVTREEFDRFLAISREIRGRP